MNAPTPTPQAKTPVTGEQILEALKSFNHADDAHWTKGGKPDLNVLKELVGSVVTRAQVDAVAADFARVVGTSPADTADVDQNDAQADQAETGADTAEGEDDAPETPAPTPQPEPKAAPAPTPKAKPSEGVVAIKNVSAYNYRIAEFDIPAGATVEINMGLIEPRTRAKIEHGIKVGSFEKV